jgi:hypothetical protein
MFATATWVWRSGSPARLFRWVNAAATRPRTLTCRMPCCPVCVHGRDSLVICPVSSALLLPQLRQRVQTAAEQGSHLLGGFAIFSTWLKSVKVS